MQKVSNNLVYFFSVLDHQFCSETTKETSTCSLQRAWPLKVLAPSLGWKRATLLCCARDTFSKIKTNLFYTANLIQSINGSQDRQLRQSPPRHRQKALEKHAWHWQANISKHSWLQWVLVLRLQNNCIASECSVPILLWQTNPQFRHCCSMQQLGFILHVLSSKVRLLAKIFCARDTWQKIHPELG